MSSCGDLSAVAVNVNGSIFVSELNLTATAELNGTTLNCSLSGGTIIGSDTVIVGG